MGFAFGNTRDMGFVKNVDWIFIILLIKQNAHDVQQSMGLGIDQYVSLIKPFHVEQLGGVRLNKIAGVSKFSGWFNCQF